MRLQSPLVLSLGLGKDNSQAFALVVGAFGVARILDVPKMLG